MLVLLVGVVVAVLVVCSLGGVAFYLGSVYLKDREKSSPYECGFDPISETRVPFSLRFFLLGIIFLIFDLETVLVFPMPYVCFFISEDALFGAVVFLSCLIFGLLHEWRQGSLEWA